MRANCQLHPSATARPSGGLIGAVPTRARLHAARELSPPPHAARVVGLFRSGADHHHRRHPAMCRGAQAAAEQRDGATRLCDRPAARHGHRVGAEEIRASSQAQASSAAPASVSPTCELWRCTRSPTHRTGLGAKAHRRGARSGADRHSARALARCSLPAQGLPRGDAPHRGRHRPGALAVRGGTGQPLHPAHVRLAHHQRERFPRRPARPQRELTASALPAGRACAPLTCAAVQNTRGGRVSVHPRVRLGFARALLLATRLPLVHRTPWTASCQRAPSCTDTWTRAWTTCPRTSR